MHLKIRETPERPSESSACKQEAKEMLETAAEFSLSQLYSPPPAPFAQQAMSNTYQYTAGWLKSFCAYCCSFFKYLETLQ